MFGLGGNHVSKTSIEHCSRLAHASSSTENEWGEGSQLTFMDSLLIQAPLDLFMVGITGRSGKHLVGLCVWVKYLHVKICTLVRGSPESFRLNVCVVRVYGYGRTVYQRSLCNTTHPG